MKPLITITERSKETHFNLEIHDIINQIEKRCNEWLESVFIKPLEYIPEEIETRNLINDLDYLFSKGIWLVEIYESLGFKIDVKEHLEYKYNEYVLNDDGYRNLIDPHKYCKKEHRLYSVEEIEESNKRINESVIKYLSKLK